MNINIIYSAALRVTGGQIPEQVRGPSSAPRRAPVTDHFAAAALALVAALTLAGCDYFGFTPIKEILATPAHFDGKEVKIQGKVTRVAKILALKGYNLRDETGEITVITYGKLPAENDEVAIKGKVTSAVIMSGSAIGLRVEETQRLR